MRFPPEVLLEIFSQLDISDILALRASNHSLHALLYHHESEIVRQYFRDKLPLDYQVIFPSPDRSTPWSLDHLCETLRRHRTCQRLSIMLSDAIMDRLKPSSSVILSLRHHHHRRHRTLSNPNAQLDPRLEARCIEIRPHFLTGLFILYDFFHRLKTATIKCIKDLQGTMSDEDFCSLTQCLNWDQQEAISSYPSHLLHSTNHIFTLLSHLVTSRLDHDPSCAQSVRTAFVMGSLDAVERSLRPQDSRKRQAAFQLAFGRAMQKAHQPPSKLVKTIRHFPTSSYRTSPAREGITRSSTSIARFIASQAYWTPSALAVMQRREMDDPWDGNLYRWIESVLKEKGNLGEERIMLRPWEGKPLI